MKKVNCLVLWKDEEIHKTFKFTKHVKLYRRMSWVIVWGWMPKSLISDRKEVQSAYNLHIIKM